MADVGSAYVTLMPSMRGFSNEVNKKLSAMDTSNGGAAMGKRAATGFAGGIASGGIIIGAASALTTKAMDAIGSSMGRAIKRVDTMQNFPKVMVNLGYSSEDAARNINVMSDSLEGLPTALDTMVAMVQQLTPLSKNMDEATQIGLAFNNMMLAGGANTQQQQSALLQYTQALAKGKPELQDWRTLQQVMPGQLDQVAKSLLGAGKKSMDLYDALKSGKVTMNDFNKAVLRLNTEGGAGFASFSQQAKDATQGIQTAMDNTSTRIAKGVATVIDAIGQENISGAINYLSSGISPLAKTIGEDFKGATQYILGFKGEFKGVVDTFYACAPVAIKVLGAMMAFKAVKGIFGAMYSGATASAAKYAEFGEKVFYAGVQIEGSAKNSGKALQGIGSALNGLTPGKMLGINIALQAFTTLAVWAAIEFDKFCKTQDNIKKSTSGLQTEIAGIGNVVTNTAGTIRTLSEETKISAASWDEFWESQAKHVDNIATIRKNLETNVITLNSSKAALEKYVGASDLGTEQQNELKAAIANVNKEFGTSYKVIDAANGKISDSKGNYDEAKAAAGEYKDAIFDLIDAKIKEWQMQALGDSYKEAYAKKIEAEKQYTAEVKQLAEDRKKYGELANAGDPWALQQIAAQENKVKQAEDNIDKTEAELYGLTQAMGTAADAANGTANTIASAFTGSNFDTFLTSNQKTLADFSQQATEVGISVETLQGLSKEQLATLANNFDGSSASIINALAAMGVGVDGYNKKQLLDKSASVEIADGQLLDAQGNIYTWNGTTLVDKNGNVCVDGTQLIDSKKRIITWNNGKLKSFSASVTLTGASAFETLMTNWNNWNPSGKSLNASNKVPNYKTNSWAKAAGKKAGGFVNLHANGGFITNGTTSLGYDRNGVMHIAGEAGREWVMGHADGTTSIVPIENRKYLEPYARGIASMIEPSGSVINNNYRMQFDYNASQGAQEMMHDFARYIRRFSMMRG